VKLSTSFNQDNDNLVLKLPSRRRLLQSLSSEPQYVISDGTDHENNSYLNNNDSDNGDGKPSETTNFNVDYDNVNVEHSYPCASNSNDTKLVNTSSITTNKRKDRDGLLGNYACNNKKQMLSNLHNHDYDMKDVSFTPTYSS
jgi:hypothetical protein